MTTYVPKPDPENVNSPENEKLVGFLILAGAALLAATAIVVFLIFNFQWLIRLTPPHWEHKAFGTKLEFLHKPPPPDLVDSFNSLKVKNNLNFAELRMSCDITPNAYVFVGGTVVVTAGLLKMMKTKAGVEFVIAHELGHLAARDYIDRLGTGVIVTLVFYALGLDSSITNLTQKLTLLSYNRDQERAADLYALHLLKGMNRSTHGATEFFEGVEKLKIDSPYLTYFSTHPATSERIENLREWMEPTNTSETSSDQELTSPWKDYVDQHCSRSSP